jgi:predicted O-methyltransferase YrrM
MRTQPFLEALPSLWDGDASIADHPRDRRFRQVLDNLGGMTTENKLALLNLAASFLEPGEVYLEIGTYLGTSVIAAALGNGGEFIAVDDFSQFGGPEKECRRNLSCYSPEQTTLVVGDAWGFLDSLDRPVGVYFYDAGHTFNDHWRALASIEPHLSDNALVIIDDASHWPVQLANRAFTRMRRQFDCVYYFRSAYNGEPRWWNGVIVYRYCRLLARPVPQLFDRFFRAGGLIIAGPPYEFSRNLAARARDVAVKIKRGD